MGNFEINEKISFMLKTYMYYHHERIHQSLGRIIEPMHKIDNSGEIACVERLGGLLKSYHRLATLEIWIASMCLSKQHARFGCPQVNFNNFRARPKRKS